MSTSLWSLATQSSRRPTYRQIDDCIAFLRLEGAIGQPVEGESMAWTVGPDLAKKLWTAFTGEMVRISSTDQIQVIMGDSQIFCPSCSTEVAIDKWQNLVEQFVSTGTDPGFLCASCGHTTPVESLRFDPDAAFTYCSVDFPEGAEPDSNSPLWKGLEAILGPLRAVWVHL